MFQLALVALVAAAIGYVYYLGGNGPRADRDAARADVKVKAAEIARVDAINLKVGRDFEEFKTSTAKQSQAQQALELQGNARREELAGIATKANVKSEAYRVEMERLRVQVKNPSPQAADESYQILLGISKSRPRR